MRAGRSSWRLRSALAAAAFFVMAGGAAAQAGQPGRITGRVVNEQSGEPLQGVQVTVKGGAPSTLTGVDGRYMLRGVPAGTHEVSAQSLGFATKTVTGVMVDSDESVVLNIALAPQAIALDGIRVSAAQERGSTVALLSQRRKTGTVTDAIGLEQIDRSPDGDAAAVLSRSPGVSVVGGKYVYVRGLGERYGQATINGSPLPSPEPDKKVVPLDLIPSDFLESVVTAKSYSPSQPGDYAGGLVQITTRNFPAYGIFKLGVSSSFNTATTFKDGYGYAGGGLDFLAMEDGTRDLPSFLPDNVRITRGNIAGADLERIGEAFIGPWGPTTSTLPPSQGVNLALGNQVTLGAERSLGYLLSVSQSSGYTNRGDLVERVFSSAAGAEPEVDYSGLSTSQQAALGGLVQLAADLSPANRVTLSAMYNRTVDDESRILEGFNLDSNGDQRNTRLQFLEQTVLTTQLKGQHHLGFLGDASLDWRGSYSTARRYEPNTREILYRETGGAFLWDDFIQSGSVFHADLNEDTYGAGLDFRVPLTFRGQPAELSLGGALELRDRSNFARRFRFRPDGQLPTEVRTRDPNDLFTTETIGPGGFQIEESTFRADNYRADQSVQAGYAMVDFELLPRIRVLTGARIEQTTQTVTPFDLYPVSNQEPLDQASLSNTDVLPAINLTYSPTDRVNFRLGASQTLARPQFRELAPFSFADYAGGFLTVGNPTLGRTLIRNLDARWEWFSGHSSLVAVSAFYKDFDDPIEVVVFPSSELIRSWANADGATNYGAEFEIRTSLGALGPAFRAIGLNANLTLVQSDVRTADTINAYLPGTGAIELTGIEDRSRPLQGQSPYVVNLGLAYASERLGTKTTILFNRFGRRIDSVGGRTLPDIYEEARSTLDIVLEQPLPGGLSAKISGKRLVGNQVEFTQAGDVVRGYDAGRTFSVSLSWGAGG